MNGSQEPLHRSRLLARLTRDFRLFYQVTSARRTPVLMRSNNFRLSSSLGEMAVAMAVGDIRYWLSKLGSGAA